MFSILGSLAQFENELRKNDAKKEGKQHSLVEFGLGHPRSCRLTKWKRCVRNERQEFLSRI
jgi:hypothetical protein